MFSLFPDNIWKNDIDKEKKEEVLVRMEFSKYRNFQYISFIMHLNKGSLKNLQYNTCNNQRKLFIFFCCLITLLHVVLVSGEKKSFTPRMLANPSGLF